MHRSEEGTASAFVLWVMELTPRLHLRYVSPAFEAVWGHSVEALALDPGLWVAGIHPEDRSGVEAIYARWITDPAAAPYKVEFRVCHTDGSMRWVRDSGELIDASGGRLQIAGVAEDITESRQALGALADERDRLRKLAATVPSIIHTLRRGADGRFSFPFGAERLAELYGVDAERLVHDATEAMRRVHPDDAPRLLARTLASAREVAPLHAQFRIQHPQRGTVWLELHTVPLRDADGATLWHGSLTDVTQRKRGEHALQQSQAQLRAVIANLSEGVVVIRLDRPVIEWNPAAAAMHGFGPDALEHHGADDALSSFEVSELDGRVLPMADWPIERTRRGETLRNLELSVRHLTQGWTKVFCYSGSLVHDDQGQPTMVLLHVSDHTERRRHEEAVMHMNQQLEERVRARTKQLESAVKELEAFSYSVSHDLRAPLRAIDGFSQAVEQDYGAQLPEAGQRYLAVIRRSAQKMGELIDDLLAFSRVSRQPVARRRVDPMQLICDARAQLASIEAPRQVEWRIGPLAPMLGDAALLRQVWINLLSNALKYTRHRDPAVIEIGMRTDAEGHACYCVSDNGAGFDMRFAGKLFGVFERLHRAEDFEGTGVGLAIVKRIVERHGGDVRGEGHPGEGATFSFYLGEPDALPTDFAIQEPS